MKHKCYNNLKYTGLFVQIIVSLYFFLFNNSIMEKYTIEILFNICNNMLYISIMGEE